MKEKQEKDRKKDQKLSISRKSKFEKALKKCPRLTISDEEVIELKNEGRK